MLAVASSDVLIDATQRMTSTINLVAPSRPHDLTVIVSAAVKSPRCQLQREPKLRLLRQSEGLSSQSQESDRIPGRSVVAEPCHLREASVRVSSGANPICRATQPIRGRYANYNGYKFIVKSQNIKLSHNVTIMIDHKKTPPEWGFLDCSGLQFKSSK